jgi:hypothetical protein
VTGIRHQQTLYGDVRGRKPDGGKIGRHLQILAGCYNRCLTRLKVIASIGHVVWFLGCPFSRKRNFTDVKIDRRRLHGRCGVIPKFWNWDASDNGFRACVEVFELVIFE